MDLGFRLVVIGLCSTAFSGGIPTEAWGVPTGTGGCSSCAELRLSLFRLHSPCVDLFNAFELYLSICVNLQTPPQRSSGRTDISISGMRSEGLDVSRSTRKKWNRVPPLPRLRIRPNPNPSMVFSARGICLFSRISVHGTVEYYKCGMQKNGFLCEEDRSDYVRIASTRPKSWDGLGTARGSHQNLIHLRQAAMNARRRNKSHKACDRLHVSRTLLTVRSRFPTSSYGQPNPPLQPVPSGRTLDPTSRLTAQGT